VPQFFIKKWKAAWLDLANQTAFIFRCCATLPIY